MQNVQMNVLEKAHAVKTIYAPAMLDTLAWIVLGENV
jgi:hypothetical protein